jgi:hypothetical protein
MREADIIPACFEAESGEFDFDEVEAFFAARREVMLEEPTKGKEVIPLVPMSRLPATVRRRWREYLDKRVEAETPMNGVKPRPATFRAGKADR